MAGRKLQNAVNKSTSGLTEEAKEVARKAVTEEPKEKKIKDPKAYLRLDLRPASCPKLKDYIYEQAGKLSAQTGEYISASGYIQRVLIADKEGKKNDKFDDIIAKIESMDKADLKLLRQILEKF